MKKCSVTAYEIARKDLNKLYKQFVDKCSGGDEKDRTTVILSRLKESQDALSKFLDVNCSFEAATMLNGSRETLVLTECLDRMTRSRIVELKKIRKRCVEMWQRAHR